MHFQCMLSYFLKRVKAVSGEPAYLVRDVTQVQYWRLPSFSCFSETTSLFLDQITDAHWDLYPFLQEAALRREQKKLEKKQMKMKQIKVKAMWLHCEKPVLSPPAEFEFMGCKNLLNSIVLQFFEHY